MAPRTQPIAANFLSFKPMSAVTFETLLRVAFGERYDAYFTDAEATVYTQFDRIARRTSTSASGSSAPLPPDPDLSFAFERVRLAVAMALLQLLVDLNADDGALVHPDELPPAASAETATEAAAALRMLHLALREARSPQEIDAMIAREAAIFERLYTDLYVDDAGELVLLLFERTLAADTRRELDRCLSEAAALAEGLVD